MKYAARLVNMHVGQFNVLMALCAKGKQKQAVAVRSARVVERRNQELVRLLAEKDEQIRGLVDRLNHQAKLAKTQHRAKEDRSRRNKRPKALETATRRIQPFRQAKIVFG